MKKDSISKKIIKELLIKDISKYILNIELDEIVFLENEYQRVESRRADIVVKVQDKYILHLELQSSYDSKMAYRMLRYYLDIKEFTNLPIKQYLINLSSKNIANSLDEDEIRYRFEKINIKDLDCETFLKTNSPDAIVLAILCDFKDKRPIEVTKNIWKFLDKLAYRLFDENWMIDDHYGGELKDNDYFGFEKDGVYLMIVMAKERAHIIIIGLPDNKEVKEFLFENYSFEPAE